MISYKEALKLIKEMNISALKKEKIPLNKSLNRATSTDIRSPINMPPFHQSAMDGYAVCFGDAAEKSFNVKGEVAAGEDATGICLNQGEAVRIFTGAMLPENCNAVIMQEKVKKVNNKQIIIEDELYPGKNIRPAGEQIKEGNIAVKRGTFLNAGTIGYLAGLGINKVEVYKAPEIAIITTGNELISHEMDLEPGKIFESNSIMIASALRQLHFNKISLYKLNDDYNQTLKELNKLSQQFDLLLFSGGISVGDYDFVGKALQMLDAETYFYKINQKPGKPLYFGRLNKSYVFGLPGNPAASLNSVLVYVYPFLNKFYNLDKSLPSFQLQLLHPYIKKDNKTHFIKARVNEQRKVEILEAQSSSMLKSYTKANALAIIPENKREMTAEDMVEVYLLPF